MFKYRSIILQNFLKFLGAVFLALMFFMAPTYSAKAGACDDISELNEYFSNAGFNMDVLEINGISKKAEFGIKSQCTFEMQSNNQIFECARTLLTRASNYYEIENTVKGWSFVDKYTKLIGMTLEFPYMAVINHDLDESDYGLFPNGLEISMEGAVIKIDRLLNSNKGWMDVSPAQEEDFLSFMVGFAKKLSTICPMAQESDAVLAEFIESRQ